MKPASFVLALVLLLAGCGGGDDEPAPATTTEEAPEAAAPEIPVEEGIEEAGADRLKVSADFLTAGAGAVWGNWEASMVRIDPETGEETDVIRVPESPCGGSAFGEAALWTQTCFEEGLARIDPKSLKVSHLRLETSDLYNSSTTIGIGEGSVWVVADGKGCEACVLLGVDTKSMEVAHEVEIEPGASAVDVGFGKVWVANPERGVVEKVDPKSDEVETETPVEGSPQYVTIGEEAVWVFDQLGGDVVKLNAEGEEAQVIPADMAGAGGSIATGNGSVWVRGALTLLEEIDAESGEVLARYGPRSGGGDVIVSDGYVWISRYEEDFEDILRLPVPSP